MHPQYTEADVARFWSRVDKSGDCWTWTGHHSAFGHGHLTVQGRTRFTHRIAWELHHGPIPNGLFVCHRCDNPPCVRPDHLFLGTQSDNIRDMYAKGRGLRGDAHYSRTQPERLSRGDRHYTRQHPEKVMRGEQHGIAKLNEAAVREIRRLYDAGGVTQTALAEMFGTDQTNVSLIVRRKAWTHIT